MVVVGLKGLGLAYTSRARAGGTFATGVAAVVYLATKMSWLPTCGINPPPKSAAAVLSPATTRLPHESTATATVEKPPP